MGFLMKIGAFFLLEIRFFGPAGVHGRFLSPGKSGRKEDAARVICLNSELMTEAERISYLVPNWYQDGKGAEIKKASPGKYPKRLK